MALIVKKGGKKLRKAQILCSYFFKTDKLRFSDIQVNNTFDFEKRKKVTNS